MFVVKISQYFKFFKAIYEFEQCLKISENGYNYSLDLGL